MFGHAGSTILVLHNSEVTILILHNSEVTILILHNSEVTILILHNSEVIKNVKTNLKDNFDFFHRNSHKFRRDFKDPWVSRHNLKWCIL
jgi:hypothetical protein